MFDLCAIGNALVDIIVKTDDDFLRTHNVAKGAMTLVDAATTEAIYKHGCSAVEMSSGGSTANSIAGAASLGSCCAFLGKVGQDKFGEVFTHDLHTQHVHFTAKPSPELATGHCLILVTPDAQRSMMTHLGAATEFGPEDVDMVTVQSASITYMEGYLFDKPAAQQAFGLAAKLAHAAGRKVALTLSDTFCVTRHREAFLDLVRGNIDILFANEGEVRELYQTQDLPTALAALREQTSLAIVTRGAQGAVITAGDKTIEIAAHPVNEVVDTTGAGDMFAAGFLYGLTQNKPLPECGRIGAIAAAEVISHFGPRPQKKLKGLI
jgi:sugar/nucleoside kinase (ribokinase family)